MPSESMRSKRERAVEFCRRLEQMYGPVECFLDHESPFRLTIAVMLSAQTTDAQVNKVTPELFRRWPTPQAMAQATPDEVADVIRSLGFYKSKARHAVEASQMIVADYAGEVPCDMKKLTRLPGVGRKTANIVMNVGFGVVEGIAVDTHVNRIAHRLRLSPKPHESEPLKTARCAPRARRTVTRARWVTSARRPGAAREVTRGRPLPASAAPHSACLARFAQTCPLLPSRRVLTGTFSTFVPSRAIARMPIRVMPRRAMVFSWDYVAPSPVCPAAKLNPWVVFGTFCANVPLVARQMVPGGTIYAFVPICVVAHGSNRHVSHKRAAACAPNGPRRRDLRTPSEKLRASAT